MDIGPLRLHSIQRMKEVLMTMNPDLPQRQGLYDPSFEHDSCGVNFIANLKGHKSHKIVSSAIGALCQLQHRGALGSEENTGDGAGILIQVPDEFFRNYFVCSFLNHFRWINNIRIPSIKKSSICSIIYIKFLFFS